MKQYSSKTFAPRCAAFGPEWNTGQKGRVVTEPSRKFRRAFVGKADETARTKDSDVVSEIHRACAH
jgi:hypothetical protein